MNLRNKSEIVHAKFDGDKLKILQVEDTTDIQHNAYIDRQLDNNGFTDGRQFRKIATIPETVMAEHPEFKHDRRALNLWLQNEGAAFRTVRGGI
jgi:hypothetical protein